VIGGYSPGAALRQAPSSGSSPALVPGAFALRLAAASPGPPGSLPSGLHTLSAVRVRVASLAVPHDTDSEPAEGASTRCASLVRRHCHCQWAVWSDTRATAMHTSRLAPASCQCGCCSFLSCPSIMMQEHYNADFGPVRVPRLHHIWLSSATPSPAHHDDPCRGHDLPVDPAVVTGNRVMHQRSVLVASCNVPLSGSTTQAGIYHWHHWQLDWPPAPFGGPGSKSATHLPGDSEQPLELLSC
jgi:hypothetical protein